MSLKSVLRSRPVIYEIVPPRRDISRFNTELQGVDEVLHDSRIAAINVPELINTRREREQAHYSPATIPPEEYAMMIKDNKESIVNIIAPRLAKDEFLRRARRVLHEYDIPNLIVVGKERRNDVLPGPSVVEALGLLKRGKHDQSTLGGICIFNRRTSGSAEYPIEGLTLSEPERVQIKADAGCDFVTSQITFEAQPVLDFLQAYQDLCEKSGSSPLTVFVSLATVPSSSILALIEKLDVLVPERVKRRLLGSESVGQESLRVATEIFQEIISEAERLKLDVPLGLQIEQIGVYNDEPSLRLLDNLYPML